MNVEAARTRNQNSSEEKTNGTRHHGSRGKRSNTTDNINGTHAIDGGHHINQNATGNHTHEIHHNEHQQGSSANTTHGNHENAAQHGSSNGHENHRNQDRNNEDVETLHKQGHEQHQGSRTHEKYEDEDRQHSGHQQGGSDRRDENNRNHGDQHRDNEDENNQDQ